VITTAGADGFIIGVAETDAGYYVLTLFCVRCERYLGPKAIAGWRNQRGWPQSVPLSTLELASQRHRCSVRPSADSEPHVKP